MITLANPPGRFELALRLEARGGAKSEAGERARQTNIGEDRHVVLRVTPEGADRPIEDSAKRGGQII